MAARNHRINNRNACAACKHQRKRCDDNCVMAPYFPADKAEEFEAVHSVFGVKNVSKKLKSLDVQHREVAVKSFIWEARAWMQDGVGGPLQHHIKVTHELELLKRQLEILSSAINSRKPMNNCSRASLLQQEGVACFPKVPYRERFPDLQTGRIGLQSPTFPAPFYQPVMPGSHGQDQRARQGNCCQGIGYNRTIQTGGHHGRGGSEGVVFQGQPGIIKQAENHVALTSRRDGGPLGQFGVHVPNYPHDPVQRPRPP